MITKKTFKAELDKYLSQLDINNQAKLKESDIRLNTGYGSSDDNSNNELNKIYDESDFNMIQNNQIPESFTWELWRMTNMFSDYWAYRYNLEFPEKSIHTRKQIRCAIKYARQYGFAGIEKSTGIAYSLNYRDGKLYGIPCSSLYGVQDYLTYSKADGTYNVSDKYQGKDAGEKEFQLHEVATLRARTTGIGDMVWYLIPMLEHIYATKLLKSNITLVKNTIGYLVNDLDNAKNEVKQYLNPFRNIIFMLKSKKFNKERIGDWNNLKESKFNTSPHVKDLIDFLKYDFETMLYWMGISQSSSKNQSLSSDLALGVATKNIFAKTFDEPVEEFLDELGIKMTIDEPDLQPLNQNADKEGNGKSNTEKDLMEKRENE